MRPQLRFFGSSFLRALFHFGSAVFLVWFFRGDSDPLFGRGFWAAMAMILTYTPALPHSAAKLRAAGLDPVHLSGIGWTPSFFIEKFWKTNVLAILLSIILVLVLYLTGSASTESIRYSFLAIVVIVVTYAGLPTMNGREYRTNDLMERTDRPEKLNDLQLPLSIVIWRLLPAHLMLFAGFSALFVSAWLHLSGDSVNYFYGLLPVGVCLLALSFWTAGKALQQLSQTYRS